MLSKKVVISFLVCSAVTPCLGMVEYLETGVKGVTDTVSSLYITGRDKANPFNIFKVIEEKWLTSKDRKKVTLLHKLDRGFLDGHLQRNDLPKLLDDLESIYPKYQICPLTIDKIYSHLISKLPTIKTKEALFKRTITTMYLLKPNNLAERITNNTFINNVSEPTSRENIIGTTMKLLADKKDSVGINALVNAIQQNENVELGKTAKDKAITFLKHLSNTTKKDLNFLLDIKKDEEKNNNNNNEGEEGK